MEVDGPILINRQIREKNFRTFPILDARTLPICAFRCYDLMAHFAQIYGHHLIFLSMILQVLFGSGCNRVRVFRAASV